MNPTRHDDRTGEMRILSMTRLEGEYAIPTSDQTTICSATFGHMVRNATPHMEAYHGDLWHDAHSIQPLIAEWAAQGGRLTFYHQIRTHGTHLATRQVDLAPQRDAVALYRYDLVCIRQPYVFDVRLQVNRMA